MARLIDADELIKQGYEIVADGLQYEACNKSIDIDDIPTAYDVNKVVEELEHIMVYEVLDGLLAGEWIKKEQVLKILKECGKNE